MAGWLGLGRGGRGGDRFVMIEDAMLKRDPLRAVVFWLLCSCAARWQMWRTTRPQLWECLCVFITGYEVISNACNYTTTNTLHYTIVYVHYMPTNTDYSGRSSSDRDRGVVVVMECSLQIPDRALTLATCRHPAPL